MAETTYGRRASLPDLQASVIEWAVPRSEILIVASLMAAAFALRIWGLGDMALHHDESLHAQYSWYLYSGNGYEHNPLMHGPFLFHSGAAIFFLFGDSDMTARLLPAIFGTVLVGMPYLLRRQIGMPAVIIAAVLLMFSPTLLYYSRFFRNDIYIAVWTFATVICVWRYLDEVKPRYLYGLAFFMAMGFATKEVTFITIAIMLIFVNLMLAVELGRRREGEAVSDGEVLRRTLLLAPIAWFVAGLWPLLGPKFKFGRESLPPIGDVMVVLGTLSLPQYAAGIQVLPFVGDRGYNVDAEDALRVGTVVSLLLISVYVGLLWRPKVWLIAAACFFVPFVLLYTTFFTNIDGFFSGIWGSLDYWLDQHHERRGNQPQYYYGLLTPLYEFLPLLAGLAGAAWFALRGTALSRWLLFWLAGIFIGLSVAGEKMPWLEVHIVLPLVLLGALALAKVIDVLELRGARWTAAAGAAGVTGLAVLLILEGEGAADGLGVALLLAVAVYLVYTLAHDLPEGFGARVREALGSLELQVTVAVITGLAVIMGLLSLPGVVDAWGAVWVIALLPIVIVGYALGGAMAGSKAFGRAALAVGVAALMTLTVRASLTATYTHDDTPVELLVYTQTSPDIPDLRDRIDALAERSGLGHNLPIVIDAKDSFAWPWAWYLRDYNQVSFATVDGDYEPPPGAVLMINRSNVAQIDASQYSQTPYKHRWWFNETYRELNFREAADGVLEPQSRSALVSFFFHRRPASTSTGSIDGVAYFPNDLSAFDQAPGSQAEPSEPTLLADGRIVIGSATAALGTAVRGELWQPADVFVDGQGNIWVADGRNHRIQKFDAQGNFLTAFGRAGNTPGTFNEPWGVAVDAQGFVYVADTWNHRIQRFTPEFDFVTSWGVPGASTTDPLRLFGPRDIAIGPDGSVWITDTGNQRLLRFSPDGEHLQTIGGPESGLTLSEPVGLAFDDGALSITDAWNARILRFDGAFAVQSEIGTGWTSRDVLAKPYIAILSDGRVLITEPESGNLVIFDSDGERIGAWKPLQDSMPVGVAALPDGGFVFSDVRRNEVQVVPGDLVDGLFQ